MKRSLSLLLALAICLSLAVPAAAADSDFSISGGTLTRYRGHDSEVVIPDGVTRIADKAFRSCTDVVSVTLPEGLASMGRDVFMGCSSLESVTFPTTGKAVETWRDMDSLAFWEDVLSCEAHEPARGGYYYIFYRPSGPLAELVNCPCELLAENITANEALLSPWINPGQCITTQSAAIVAKSNEICAGLTSDYEKAAAVFEWTAKNLRYDYDYVNGKKDTVPYYPEEVLQGRLTVCEGYTRLSQALLQAQGVPALAVHGASDIDGDWPAPGTTDHAWNVVFADGRWVYFDATWAGPSDWDDRTGRVYGYDPYWFDPTIVTLSKDHVGMKLIVNPDDWNELKTSAADTPSAWAQDEVWSAICAGLVPNDVQAAYRNYITRADFCRLMVRLVEADAGKSIADVLASRGLTATDPFTDTDNSDVLAAYALGIVSGKSETTFVPNGAITRQEAAAMLSRTAKLLNVSTSDGENFTDSAAFAAWAGESIAFISGVTDPATGSRVMGGTGGGKFSPNAAFTREQAVMTALRLLHCAA